MDVSNLNASTGREEPSSAGRNALVRTVASINANNDLNVRSSSRLGTASRASPISARNAVSVSMMSLTARGSNRAANSAASSRLIDACRTSVDSMYC